MSSPNALDMLIQISVEPYGQGKTVQYGAISRPIMFHAVTGRSARYGATSFPITFHKAVSGIKSTPPIEPPGGNVREIFPGQWATVYAQAQAGDTLYLRGGIHNKITLDRSFSAIDRVTVTCEPGTLAKGVDVIGSAGGYIFDTFYSRILASEVDINDETIRSFNINGPVHDVRVIRSVLQGSYITFSPYSGSSPCTNIELRDSDLSMSWGDLIHPNNVNGLIVDHNILHDLQHLTGEHHDCFQPQSLTNFEFTRNTCYWLSGPGAYTGPGSGIGQCIMISGNAGAVSNGLIANNLMHHYNGRAMNMNGVSNLKIVNNTIDLCGDGISMTFGTNTSGIEVWNNIAQSAYVDAVVPAYLDYNWWTTNRQHTHNYPDFIQGTTYWTGNPSFVDSVNYELTAGSAARGKGVQRSGTPTVDLDGNTRTGLVLGCRI